MKPSYWTYPDPTHQTVYYRGFVRTYEGHIIKDIPCPDVHKNKWKAFSDAKRMMKKFSTHTPMKTA